MSNSAEQSSETNQEQGAQVNNGEELLAEPAKVPWWWRCDPNRRRLHGEVIAFRGELRASRADPTVETLNHTSWQEVSDLVRVAGDRAASGPVSAGFEALNAAGRVTVEGYSIEKIGAVARGLEAEAQDRKLSEWRRAAITTLLEQLNSESSRHLVKKRALLREAIRLRDEGNQTSHRKSDVVVSRYMVLLIAVLVLVSVLVAVSLATPIDITASATEVTWTAWAYAFLFGALGASVSAGISLSKRRPRERVPELRASIIGVAYRPVFGGAAAIGAWAILSAGLFGNLDVTNGTALAVAFLAGFSERLIDSASQSLDRGTPA